MEQQITDKRKRLLLLGGSLWKDAIRQYAEVYNIRLAATGNDQSAGIFEIAEEHYDIDSTDIEGMKRLLREQQFDGVYMGGSEPVIAAASQYLNELNMPCYCTHEQWEYLQDKAKFKQLCQDFGLPVVPQFNIDSTDIEHSVPIEFFPVITKPTDGCGSNGFSVCHNPNELKIGYEKAKENSPTQSVLCEKFVKNDSVVVFYTFSNGKLFFSGLEDKISVKFPKQGTYVGGLFIFESKLTEEFRQRFEVKLTQLFNSIGIREGSAWIEVFYDDGKYYFNEVGFRYGGSISVYPVDYLHGYNQVAADIHYAMTGKSKITGHPTLINKNIPRKCHYAIYPVYICPGTISSIEGVEKLVKSSDIVLCSLTKNIGSVIPDSGSFNQNFAVVHFVYDTIQECGKILQNINQTLKVKNESGMNMVIKMLDFEKLVIKD